MNFVRTPLTWVCRALFRLFVLLAITAYALNSFLFAPQNLKDILHDSKVYDRIAQVVVDESQANGNKDQSKDKTEDIDPESLKKIIQDSLPPAEIQGYTEQIIDGFYGWIDGKTDKPEFRLDLSKARKDLINGVADYGVNRLKSLPACTQLPRGDIDPFKATCRPQGLTDKQLRTEIRKDLEHNDDLPFQDSFTSDDLNKDKDESVDEKLTAVPKIASLTKNAPLIFGSLSLLLAAAIVLLHQERRRGLQKVGWSLFGNGAIVVVLGFLASKTIEKLQPTFDNEATRVLVEDTVRTATNHIVMNFLVAGGLVLGLGLAILLGERFSRPKNPTTTESNFMDTQAPAEHAVEDPQAKTNNKTEHEKSPETKE